MYLPPHFEETDPSQVYELIDKFPLAILVAQTEQGLVANHVPLMLQGKHELLGHLALNNDLHQLLPSGKEILAIFRGEDAYISPNWYPTKPIHHRHVPTWNYQVVHVYGTIHYQDDDKSKLAVVGKLTKKMEERTHGENAWRMADAPKDYLNAMLANIIAFRIEITRILGKSKVSQNRETVDFGNVAKVLAERGSAHMAERMNQISETREKE
jgi:transcriptional regulator